MDRMVSTVLFAVAVLSLGGAGVLLLNGFVEYLQSGAWTATSLLELGYNTHLIRARWFLSYEWSWGIHDALAIIPIYGALLGAAPICWWLSRQLGQR